MPATPTPAQASAPPAAGSIPIASSSSSTIPSAATSSSSTSTPTPTVKRETVQPSLLPQISRPPAASNSGPVPPISTNQLPLKRPLPTPSITSSPATSAPNGPPPQKKIIIEQIAGPRFVKQEPVTPQVPPTPANPRIATSTAVSTPVRPNPAPASQPRPVSLPVAVSAVVSPAHVQPRPNPVAPTTRPPALTAMPAVPQPSPSQTPQTQVGPKPSIPNFPRSPHAANISRSVPTRSPLLPAQWLAHRAALSRPPPLPHGALPAPPPPPGSAIPAAVLNRVSPASPGAAAARAAAAAAAAQAGKIGGRPLPNSMLSPNAHGRPTSGASPTTPGRPGSSAAGPTAASSPSYSPNIPNPFSHAASSAAALASQSHHLGAPPASEYPNIILPSYEDMLVEAISALEAAGLAHPAPTSKHAGQQGVPPRVLFHWMADRYPLMKNFRPSASQALQKALKRGRFLKVGSLYRLNPNFVDPDLVAGGSSHTGHGLSADSMAMKPKPAPLASIMPPARYTVPTSTGHNSLALRPVMAAVHPAHLAGALNPPPPPISGAGSGAAPSAVSSASASATQQNPATRELAAIGLHHTRTNPLPSAMLQAANAYSRAGTVPLPGGVPRKPPMPASWTPAQREAVEREQKVAAEKAKAAAAARTAAANAAAAAAQVQAQAQAQQQLQQQQQQAQHQQQQQYASAGGMNPATAAAVAAAKARIIQASMMNKGIGTSASSGAGRPNHLLSRTGATAPASTALAQGHARFSNNMVTAASSNKNSQVQSELERLVALLSSKGKGAGNVAEIDEEDEDDEDDEDDEEEDELEDASKPNSIRRNGPSPNASGAARPLNPGVANGTTSSVPQPGRTIPPLSASASNLPPVRTAINASSTSSAGPPASGTAAVSSSGQPSTAIQSELQRLIASLRSDTPNGDDDDDDDDDDEDDEEDDED